MTNRVLFDANGLKVSAAGYNVLTASYTNLIFSSDFTQPFIRLQGTMNGFSASDIEYGITFTQRPLVIFDVKQVNDENYFLLGVGSYYHDYVGNVSGNDIQLQVYGYATTTKIVKNFSLINFGSSNLRDQFMVRYTVLSFEA